MMPSNESILYIKAVPFCLDSSFSKVSDISFCLVNISSFFEIIRFRPSFCLPNVFITLSLSETSLFVKSKLLLTSSISFLQKSPLIRSFAIFLAMEVSISTLFDCVRHFVFCIAFCEIPLIHTSIVRLKVINLNFFIFF